MATTPTQIRIDSDVKKKALDLFDHLGLNMSSAVNIFLHQCILRGGLPFNVEIPNYSQQTLEAMEEAKRDLSRSKRKRLSKHGRIKKSHGKLLIKNILTLTLVDTGTHGDIFNM